MLLTPKLLKTLDPITKYDNLSVEMNLVHGRPFRVLNLKLLWEGVSLRGDPGGSIIVAEDLRLYIKLPNYSVICRKSVKLLQMRGISLDSPVLSFNQNWTLFVMGQLLITIQTRVGSEGSIHNG